MNLNVVQRDDRDERIAQLEAELADVYAKLMASWETPEAIARWPNKQLRWETKACFLYLWHKANRAPGRVSFTLEELAFELGGSRRAADRWLENLAEAQLVQWIVKDENPRIVRIWNAGDVRPPPTAPVGVRSAARPNPQTEFFEAEDQPPRHLDGRGLTLRSDQPESPETSVEGERDATSANPAGGLEGRSHLEGRVDKGPRGQTGATANFGSSTRTDATFHPSGVPPGASPPGDAAGGTARKSPPEPPTLGGNAGETAAPNLRPRKAQPSVVLNLSRTSTSSRQVFKTGEGLGNHGGGNAGDNATDAAEIEANRQRQLESLGYAERAGRVRVNRGPQAIPGVLADALDRMREQFTPEKIAAKARRLAEQIKGELDHDPSLHPDAVMRIACACAYGHLPFDKVLEVCAKARRLEAAGELRKPKRAYVLGACKNTLFPRYGLRWSTPPGQDPANESQPQ